MKPPAARKARQQIGEFLPFQMRSRCLENDRPCDKQRTCGACIIAGEEDQSSLDVNYDDLATRILVWAG